MNEWTEPPSTRAGSRDRVPVPGTGALPPGSCALPRTVSRVPSPKCCAWLLTVQQGCWKPLSRERGPSSRRPASPGHLGALPAHPHPLSLSPLCLRPCPLQRGFLKLPTYNTLAPGEPLNSPKTESLVPPPKNSFSSPCPGLLAQK